MEETEREVCDRELGERAVARMLVMRARAWLGPGVAADDLCPGCGQDAGHDEEMRMSALEPRTRHPGAAAPSRHSPVSRSPVQGKEVRDERI